MKVLLDLDQLLADGEIDEALYDRLRTLSVREGGNAAVNGLVGFGVSATVAGLLALFPRPEVVVGVGAVLSAAGLFSRRFGAEAWGLLATVLIVIGTLVLGGGILALTEFSLAGVAAVTGIAYAAMAAGRSRILAAEAALMTGVTVGVAMENFDVEWFFGPTLVIGLYTLLGLITLGLSRLKNLPAADREPPLTFARVCVVVVNVAFLIGTWAGDRLGGPWDDPVVPAAAFTVAWAVALVLVAWWGIKSGRVWVVRLSAAAGTLHFYTQYFKFFGGEPLAILAAGGLAIGAALYWARRLGATRRNDVAAPHDHAT
ncbi:MAG: hypothetical protein AAGJ97_11785 [Planctomycetota bacterium]